MGSCKKYFVYFVSKFKTKMIINVNLAILLVTIGSSTARPGGRRDPEAYPYAPAPDAEGRQIDWPRAPLGFAAAPAAPAAPLAEEAYKAEKKGPRQARQYLAPAAEPYAPVHEEAYKSKRKAPRQARAHPYAPLGVAAEPYAPVAEKAQKYKP